MFEQIDILLGEIRCLSLLGLEGLRLELLSSYIIERSNKPYNTLQMVNFFSARVELDISLGIQLLLNHCFFKSGNYLLFPISMMTMFELECCLASSSHVVRWLNVSLLQGKEMPQ